MGVTDTLFSNADIHLVVFFRIKNKSRMNII